MFGLSRGHLLKGKMPLSINPIAAGTIFLKQLKKPFRISLHLTVKYNYIFSLFFYTIDTFD